MDHKFTEQIRQWLETHEDERDYAVGALYLLKLSGNQIMYKNIISQIDRRHDFVEYQLQKYYNFRVQALTHAQVEEMAAQVKTIADEHHLTDDASTVPEDERRLGKREDHDSLPDEIKAKYVENLSLLQRMRELHLRLRSLSLDKKLHSNWEAYDHYVAPGPDAVPSRLAKASSALPLGSAKKRSAAGSKSKKSS